MKTNNTVCKKCFDPKKDGPRLENRFIASFTCDRCEERFRWTPENPEYHLVYVLRGLEPNKALDIERRP